MIAKNAFYDYIQSLIGVPVNNQTMFFEELGIDGFDAELFMMSFRDKYQVDMRLYDPYLYHSPDNIFGNTNPIKYFYWLIFDRSKLKKKKFTALHLYNVAVVGKWFDPS